MTISANSQTGAAPATTAIQAVERWLELENVLLTTDWGREVDLQDIPEAVVIMEEQGNLSDIILADSSTDPESVKAKARWLLAHETYHSSNRYDQILLGVLNAVAQ